MRRKDREVTDAKWIEQVLREGQWLSLAMVDDEGKPYVVPMNYGYGGSFLVLHGAGEGTKVKYLKARPTVSFTVVVGGRIQADADSARYTYLYKSVCGLAEAVFVTDREEKRECLNILLAQYHAPAQYLPDAVVDVTCVLKLELKQLTGKSNGGARGNEG